MCVCELSQLYLSSITPAVSLIISYSLSDVEFDLPGLLALTEALKVNTSITFLEYETCVCVRAYIYVYRYIYIYVCVVCVCVCALCLPQCVSV